ncbi:MAG: alpha-L-rhamnosidase C-terminal domain-containing protein [Thalassotalea sp.]
MINKTKLSLKIASVLVCSSIVACTITTGADNKSTDNSTLNSSVNIASPEKLRVDLLAGAWVKGVKDQAPEFTWSLVNITQQNAYQIQVQSADKSFNEPLLWDSAKVNAGQSLSISYAGETLQPASDYQWRVKVWGQSDNNLKSTNNSAAVSNWSQVQRFTTANKFDHWASQHPLEGSPVPAKTITTLPSGNILIDFGKVAFGYVSFSLTSDKAGTIKVHFGERGSEQGIKRDLTPKTSVRYYTVDAAVHENRDIYSVHPPRDKRNTKPNKAIPIPGRFGRIAPFRYVEIEAQGLNISDVEATQLSVHYPFDPYASSFSSSSSVLNDIWDLCKYSMKATSFAGVYVDGDRERIPYEADAYINQLSHYLVDDEYSLARYSHEYLLAHPTWPTEWKQHSIMMAWTDWMYTGDTESIKQHFDTFKKEKTLEQHARKDGLLVSFPDQKVRPPKNRDIVDWPASERDNFDFKPVNAVINAFHYLNLKQMADMAKAVGKNDEQRFYTERAKQVYQAFNKVLFNQETGVYLDGEGSTHSGFHANVAALAFGLVPQERQAKVVALIKHKGMAGSVYFAQYLLEALYIAGESDYALSLMTAETTRSWFNMLRVGSTITLEAWDDKFKPNQDWNHAWGAVPGNIVGRYLLGVTPLEAGFKRIKIAPQLSELSFAQGRVPTIRGEVYVNIRQAANNALQLQLTVPANSEAELHIPKAKTSDNLKAKVMINAELAQYAETENSLLIPTLTSGQYTISVTY